MNCNEVAANLQLLVDDELSDEKIAEIRNHLENCTGCIEKFEAEMMFKQVLHDKICKKCAPGAWLEDVRSRVLMSV
jgi:mycothiol system anti-sigma-R factor